MKLDIINALIKRFNKVDDKIKALHENVTSHESKFNKLSSGLNAISESVAQEEASKKKFAQELISLNRNIKSLGASQKQILLQEPKEPKKGDKGEPGESVKGDKGDAVKGDTGRGIKKMFINKQQHWIVIYTDDTRVDLGLAVSETEYKGGYGLASYDVPGLARRKEKTITFADTDNGTHIMKANEDILFVDATGGNIIVVPQIAAQTKGEKSVFMIDGEDEGNTVDIVPSGGELISGEANRLITVDYAGWTWISDRTQLIRVA